MVAQIEALRPQVDVLAVAFHWGAEYVSLPADRRPASPTTTRWRSPTWRSTPARTSSSATTRTGCRRVEIYKGKFIAYAHGNFIFDQMWSYETRVGVIGKYTFYDDELIGVEYTPTLIENYAQPVPMQGAERAGRAGRDAGGQRAAGAGRGGEAVAGHARSTPLHTLPPRP